MVCPAVRGCPLWTRAKPPAAGDLRPGRLRRITTGFQIAQLNVAEPLSPPGSAGMATFEALLDEVNAIADAAPGFVWRLQEEGEGNATSFRAFDSETMIVNMSVW